MSNMNLDVGGVKKDHARQSRAMDHEAVKSLGELYEKSVERTRRVWLVLQIFTIVVFMAVFNHRFSWFRTKMVRDAINVEELRNSPDSLYHENMAEVLGYSYHSAVEHEGKMKFIELDWIGSEVYADDLPIMGSVGLSILLAWYIFTYRRMVGILRRIRGLFQKGLLRSSGKDLLRDQVSFIQIFNETEDDREAMHEASEDRNRFGSKLVRWALTLSKRGLRFLISAPLWLLLVIWGLDAYETFLADREEVLRNFIAEKSPEEIRNSRSSRYKATTWNVYLHPSAKLEEEAKKYGITDHIGSIKLEILARTILPLLVFALCGIQLKAAWRLWKNEEAYSHEIENGTEFVPKEPWWKRFWKGAEKKKEKPTVATASNGNDGGSPS